MNGKLGVVRLCQIISMLHNEEGLIPIDLADDQMIMKMKNIMFLPHFL